MLRERVVGRLPWIGALLCLATATVLLLGPLWDSAVGENPLDRPPDPDIPSVLRLALPTVVVLGAVAVALCAGRQRVLGGLFLLVTGYAALAAPAPLPLWFLPGLLVTALGYAVTLRRPRRTDAASTDRREGRRPRVDV